MKILMVISEAPPIKSGVARVADRLCAGFKKRGHHVDVLSSDTVPRLDYGEVRLSSMPLRMSRLKHKFQHYDLIHLHGPVPTFSDVFLLWGLRGLGPHRPRLVYTHHAPIDFRSLPLRPLTWTYNALQERFARFADHVVTSTPSYNQRLARYIPAGKLSVIPWGVDYPLFNAPLEKDEPFTVVYLGQIRPYKGLPVLLRAAEGVPNMRLWVIGDGHSSKAAQKEAARLNLPDVTFWGPLPDQEMIRRLKQAHVIVLPSITHCEAFGIALLEGMAAGLVPVASYIPGVADLVGNEGITFHPGDYRALRAILARLRDDPPLRLHLASLAQAKARLYSWERVVFGYERIFNNLVVNQAPKTVRTITDIPTQPFLHGYTE
ncbi:MAG TPA: glycosyltransferase family 4 protein [Anaerolineales bacterium]|jgi:rhamnosyl/mannosyltransferase|nr:glycosyltransferase family 4 protein [Anaerolineales bacterium]